jgi:hypothetical protein
MPLKRFAAGIAIVICLYAPAAAEMYKIDNPASKIYNPATRMNNPNPLSPPTQPVPPPAASEVTIATEPAIQLKGHPQAQPKPTTPHKRYKFRTAGEYITAAKKAFNQDDYKEFLSITEEALRKINAGTLKASKAARQKLNKYKVVGYGLINKD